MTYHSTRPLPKAPKRADVSKVRAALRSDIASAERYKEICEEGEQKRVQARIECLRKVLEGTYL